MSEKPSPSPSSGPTKEPFVPGEQGATTSEPQAQQAQGSSPEPPRSAEVGEQGATTSEPQAQQAQSSSPESPRSAEVREQDATTSEPQAQQAQSSSPETPHSAEVGEQGATTSEPQAQQAQGSSPEPPHSEGGLGPADTERDSKHSAPHFLLFPCLTLLLVCGLAFVSWQKRKTLAPKFPAPLQTCQQAAEEDKDNKGEDKEHAQEPRDTGTQAEITESSKSQQKLFLQLAVDVSGSVDLDVAKAAFDEITNHLKSGDCLRVLGAGLGTRPFEEQFVYIQDEPQQAAKRFKELLFNPQLIKDNRFRTQTDLLEIFKDLKDVPDDTPCNSESFNMASIVVSDFLHQAENSLFSGIKKPLKALISDLFEKRVALPQSFSRIDVFNTTTAIVIKSDSEFRNKRKERIAALEQERDEFFGDLKTANGIFVQPFRKGARLGRLLGRLRLKYSISIALFDHPDGRTQGSRQTITLLIDSNYPPLTLPFELKIEGHEEPVLVKLRVQPWKKIYPLSTGIDNPSIDKIYIDLSAPPFLKMEQADTPARLHVVLLRKDLESFILYEIVNPERIYYLYPGSWSRIRLKFQNRSNRVATISPREQLRDRSVRIGDIDPIPPRGTDWCMQDLIVQIDSAVSGIEIAPVSQIKGFNLNLDYVLKNLPVHQNPLPTISTNKKSEFDAYYIVPDFRRWRLHQLTNLLGLGESYRLSGYSFLLLMIIYVIFISRKLGPRTIGEDNASWKLLGYSATLLIVVLATFSLYTTYDMLSQNEYDYFSYWNRVFLGVALALSVIELIKICLVLQYRYLRAFRSAVVSERAVSERTVYEELHALLNSFPVSTLISIIVIILELVAAPGFTH